MGGKTVRPVVFALALLLAGCSNEPRLRIGSKNFTEQYVLGEIIARHVGNRLHIHISRHFGIGGDLLADQAIESGDIDLFPEYTGTALMSVLKQKPDRDPARVMQTVRDGYAPRGLIWLDPLGFEDTFAMVVRNSDTGAATLSDAARERTWRLGVGYDFAGRPDGLPGLSAAYGLRLQGKVRTMDLGLLYQALNRRQVDMVAANSTDGMLSVLPVKVLADDRQYFPPYECAIVVRSKALQQYPELRGVLEELSGKISADTMRRLNYELDGQHRPARDIARVFLRSAGLEK
jgi:glycine betaine/choline ABC-type transport system substrate-binding protein